ncbi:hypothetical protein C0Q70_16750 [Pomacea canaliculata]|uniref:Uncharacterized protein n=1 Tax=Pomacea canaliculata TaxID=400727 RepID=A0A2T7NQN8_POMCA|nr:hypothetical protein C0Q70_16750 [Pomacea canaliculata]
MSGPSGLLATCLRNVAEVVPVAELTAPWHTKLKYTDDVTVFPSHADSGYEESKTEINRRNMAMTVEEEGKWISLSTVDA